MMGIGGYTLYEVQKKLERANILLAKGHENVIELEKRLNATGTDVSKTLVSIKNRLDVNSDEIRKLWDVSNKRNKKWIKDNQSVIEKMDANIRRAQSDVSDLTRQLGTGVSVIEKARKEMKSVQQGLLDDNEELLTQITLVTGQMQDQIIEIKGVHRQLNSLARKQKDIDESISVIDKHRTLLNRELSDLQIKIGQLQDGKTVTDGN